jgi:hypothetical protein
MALLMASTAGLASDQSSEIRAVIERMQAHRRVAVEYLRTGNIDLAAIELERLRDQFDSDRRGLENVQSDPALTAALALARDRIELSLKLVEEDADNARATVENATHDLDQWRQGRGLRLFSDCIHEASQAYAAVDAHRTTPPDLREPRIGEQVRQAAADAEKGLRRCDAEASPELRAEPEFRRLVDGMLASLRRVSEAVERQDGGFLHRLLIEQRSFERLLVFRFG